MKMIIAIIRDADSDLVTQALTADSFRVTRIASTGGFLRRGVTTLLLGVDEGQVDTVIQMLKDKCPPAPDGGKRATVFVVPVSNFLQV
jgi:uncharacterized protein YaaQ